MQCNLRVIGLVVLAILLSAPASAGQPGNLFIKGSIGRADADIKLSDLSFLNDGSIVEAGLADDDTAFGFSVGYWLHKHVAVVLGYVDQGEIKMTATSDGSGSIYSAGSVYLEASVRGVTAGLAGELPINDTWSLVGTVGQFFWEGEAELENNGNALASVDDNEHDLFVSVGAQIHVDRALSLGFDYQRYDLDEGAVDILTLHATYMIPLRAR